MSFEVKTTPRFERLFKQLLKRHRSLKEDLLDLIDSLEQNPSQGDELSPGIRKIRMAISSKGRGKSGGARIITYNIFVSETDGTVYLIDIYDKGDYSTVDKTILQNIINDIMGDE